jgi:hypothetical protein
MAKPAEGVILSYVPQFKQVANNGRACLAMSERPNEPLDMSAGLTEV